MKSGINLLQRTMRSDENLGEASHEITALALNCECEDKKSRVAKPPGFFHWMSILEVKLSSEILVVVENIRLRPGILKGEDGLAYRIGQTGTE